MKVLGIPVGVDRYVMHPLNRKVNKIVKDGKKALELLRGHAQAAWPLFKWSIKK